MSEPIRIVVVDDHALFREGLRELLTHQPDLDVVAEGSTGAEAVALARRHLPDVLLLDVEMPGQRAVQTLRQLQQSVPATQVVVLTMHDDATLVQELLGSGASAYLTKTAGRQDLITAIRSVSRSAGTVLVSVPRDTFAQIGAEARATVLTRRELEVLRLLALALSNAQIANRLFISEGTVKRHLTNIYAKLQAVSRVDALRKANDARLI
jgi:DNA-binding NarL/FixJ family response regulator